MALKIHVYNIHGRKIFQCPICKWEFTKGSKLKRHHLKCNLGKNISNSALLDVNHAGECSKQHDTDSEDNDKYHANWSQKWGKHCAAKCVITGFHLSSILECTKVNLRSLAQVVNRSFVPTFSYHHINSKDTLTHFIDVDVNIYAKDKYNLFMNNKQVFFC